MYIPGTQALRSMHPAAKMCTPDAGCTLNFEQSMQLLYYIVHLYCIFQTSQDNMSDLPPYWRCKESRSKPGEFYYINVKTRVSTWIHPGEKVRSHVRINNVDKVYNSFINVLLGNLSHED